MNALAILVLSVIVLVGVFEGVIFYLHIHRFDEVLPDDAQNIYHPSSYQRFIKKEQRLFVVSVMRLVFHIGVLIVFVLSGLYLKLHVFVEQYVDSTLFQALVYMICFFMVLYLFDCLLNVIDLFYLQKKKINKKNILKIIKEQFKQFLIWFLIVIPLVGLLLMFDQTYGVVFYIFLLFLIEGAIIVFSLFFTQLIVTRVYRLKPLETGELRERIRIFLDQEGYQIEDVYVLDQGRRSSDMNAFVSGFSKRKRIVLFDTLLKRLTYDEIIAVIAHELGHQKRHHIVSNIALSWILVSMFLVVVYGLIEYSIVLKEMFSFPAGHDGFVLILGFFLLDGFILLMRTLISMRSRKLEYQADQYVKDVWYPSSLKSALVKIATKNIEHLTPLPLYVLIYYTHPVLKDRINRLLEEDNDGS